MRQFLNSDSFKERFLGRSDDDDTLAEENGQRGCPRCEHDLQKLELNGITVDVCLECIGVWLDAGELESLIRAGREHSLDGDDSLWAHEIREGLDGRDIPPDLLGHLATAVKGLFSGSHSRE